MCITWSTFFLLIFEQILTDTMDVCRWTPTSCAQMRGWTPSWWTSWCCSWTESTHRYWVTKKLTGSLLFLSETVVIKKIKIKITQSLSWSGSSSHVSSCSSGTWVFPPKCVWQSCWNTSVGRVRRRVKSSTEDFTFKPRMSTPACQQGSYKEVKKKKQGLSTFSNTEEAKNSQVKPLFRFRWEYAFVL